MPQQSAPAGQAAQTPPAGDRKGESERIFVVRSAEELASIREPWLRLVRDQITTDPDFFEVSLHADPKIERPHVVVLERDGEPAAMLVARIENLRFASRLGYLKVYAPKVRSITIVYGGILGEVDDETSRTLLRSVRASLADGEADVAIFRYLALDSPFYAIASTESSAGLRQVSAPELHWVLDLPESLDAVLGDRSGKSRRKLLNAMRRLEGEFGDRLTYRRYADSSEIDEFFRDVAELVPKTYQHQLGVGFGDTPAHRARTAFAFEQGWYRGYVLHIDGSPCAFEHGELYRGRFRTGNPGFDPALAEWGIGNYIRFRMFEDLCADDEATVLDYGVGDAEYKQRYGTRGWHEANVILYAPTLRSRWINLSRRALGSVNGLLARLAPSGGAGAIKRRWRRRLQQRGRG